MELQISPNKFILDFLQAENDLIVGNMTERSDPKFKEIVKKYRSYFAYEIDSAEAYVYRPEPITEDWFKDYEEQVEDYATGKLFIIRTYSDPKLGEIYKCITSSAYGNKKYAKLYTVAMVNGQLKICAEFNKDYSRPMWKWFRGIKMGDAKKFISVERFVEPTDRNDLEDYKSEKGLYK